MLQLEAEGACAKFKLVDLAKNLVEALTNIDHARARIFRGFLGCLPLDLDADDCPECNTVVLDWKGLASADHKVTLDPVDGAPGIMISCHTYETSTRGWVKERTSTKVVGIWYNEQLVLATPLDWRLSASKSVWPFVFGTQEAARAPRSLCRMLLSLASLSEEWQKKIAA